MIGFLEGQVLFSDGSELLLMTNSGIGYQVYFKEVIPEKSSLSIYISHVIKEASQDLYGFLTLRDKKLFEILVTVKGVGPKSAFSLISFLGCQQICSAILMDNKKLLSTAPGVGARSAAQIILDLSNKIHKIKMFSFSYSGGNLLSFENSNEDLTKIHSSGLEGKQSGNIVEETLMACKELGFSENKMIPLIQKLVTDNNLSSSEQLLHLVLKEM